MNTLSFLLATSLLGVCNADFYSALKPCPAPCVGTPDNWTVYNAVERLAVCDQPILLDFALHNSLDDPLTTVKLRACTVGDANVMNNALLSNISIINSTNALRSLGTSHVIGRNASGSCSGATEIKTTAELSVVNNNAPARHGDVAGILGHVSDFFANQTQCGKTFVFGYWNGIVVGVYSSAAIDHAATAPQLIGRLMDELPSTGVGASALIQVCGTDANSSSRSTDYLFGAISDTTGDLAAVQGAMQSWSMGKCVSAGQQPSQQEVSIFAQPLGPSPNATMVRRQHALLRRTNCKTATVASGDTCASLATKCGISAADFTKYNPSSTLCATLTVGQMVCCSTGTLPDIKPKPNPDGSCANYTVKSDDYCALIAAKNGLTVAELESFNNGTKGTWGWMGCSDLFSGINICLSTGTPPMPASMSNALCGPTVPNTKPPATGQALADLNPCPLNACCNIWGQCGIDSDFCVIQPGPSGNPGTSPPGTNGCVSNCGTEIVNRDTPPASFQKVVYYESWNWDRPCLWCRTDFLPAMLPSDTTHVHWAFATVTSSFGVELNDTATQFGNFKALPYKRIVSFGGWGYSTDPSTYNVLRQAMDPQNQKTFAQNIVNYLNDNNLDGVDFDWEYPGAPDIPGIPAGLATDGPNYLSFLTTLRGMMPTGKTMSIAAPASYWYLKSFPIADMAKELDYIVYMTYDLHGQWDYGNSWASSGCPGGNCLRSHVNSTETYLALSMITKAGVPSKSICVGVSSYGRSFKMTTNGCTGPECTYTGPDSGAQEGRCTVTAGYISNAEINEIIALNDTTIQTYEDESSASDILVYNHTQWVAYMTDFTKNGRVAQYQGLNFAGTVDWAVDLQQFTDADNTGPTGDDDWDLDGEVYVSCDASYTSLDDLDTNIPNEPDQCQAIYTLQVLNAVYQQAITNFTNLMAHDYDSKFKVYSQVVADDAFDQVDNFTRSTGNNYFSCVVVEPQFCCSKCKSIGGDVNPCKYCFDGDCYSNKPNNKRSDSTSSSNMGSIPLLESREGAPPNQFPVVKYENVSEPCPPDYSARGISGQSAVYEDATLYWTLKPGAPTDQFFADLLTNVGIDKQYIQFQDWNHGGCAPADSTAECQMKGDWDIGYPRPVGYNASDIANPKDTVQQALNNGADLGSQIDDAILALQCVAYPGDPYELIDAVSLPILMIVEAVDQMSSVVDSVNQIEAEKRKETILAWLSAILFIVPIAGELLGSVAALASVGRIIAILGALGNAAQDIYSIITDPSNAPLAIVDLVLTPLSLADAAKVGQASDLRRGMADTDVAKLGTTLESRMKSLQRCTGVCMKKA